MKRQTKESNLWNIATIKYENDFNKEQFFSKEGVIVHMVVLHLYMLVMNKKYQLLWIRVMIVLKELRWLFANAHYNWENYYHLVLLKIYHCFINCKMQSQ